LGGGTRGAGSPGRGSGGGCRGGEEGYGRKFTALSSPLGKLGRVIIGKVGEGRGNST